MTMGVQFAEISKKDPVLSIALNAEKHVEDVVDDADSSAEMTSEESDAGSVDAADVSGQASTEEDEA